MLNMRRHDVPFILLIGGIIAYGFALAVYTVANSDVFGLVTLNGDDAFYYFQVARNTAEGHFSSFDGGITRTNGYHPLWMFLLVPFFLAFDAESALFAIKFFETLVLASGIALVALAARLARLPWPPLIAVPLAIFPQRSFLIGMEPALALFMLALLFVALALWARDSRMAAPVAALLFLLPWARTEYVAISLTVAAALFVIERSWRRAGFRESLLPLAGALCGFAAYLAYNQLVFGGAVPVSGAVKHAWSQELWDALGGFDLAQNFLLAARERWVDNLAALAVCAAAVPVWRRAQRSDHAEDRLFVVFYAGILALAAAHLAKLAQTVLFMHADFGIYRTYYVPGDLMMPLLAAVVWRLAAKPVGRVANRRWVGIPVAGAVAVGAVFALHGPFENIEEARDDPAWRWGRASWAGTMIMNRILPEGSVVGSWDAGIIGYFSRFPVVNLDGLVNSWDYLRAGGPLAPRMTFEEPQRGFGLTHLVNGGAAPEARVDGAVFVGVPHMHGDLDSDFKLVSVAPSAATAGGADPQAAFWAKLEPHFLYRRGDAGVVADGRVVQAFFEDCDPEKLRERKFTISWTPEGDETRTRHWFPGRDARRNQMGLCAAVLLLPGKGGVPVRISESEER